MHRQDRPGFERGLSPGVFTAMSVQAFYLSKKNFVVGATKYVHVECTCHTGNDCTTSERTARDQTGVQLSSLRTWTLTRTNQLHFAFGGAFREESSVVVQKMFCFFPPALESNKTSNYYPGQKNRYSRHIHEIDPQCDHVISQNLATFIRRSDWSVPWIQACDI